MKKKNRKAEKEDESALEGNLWIETVHWNWKKYKEEEEREKSVQEKMMNSEVESLERLLQKKE